LLGQAGVGLGEVDLDGRRVDDPGHAGVEAAEAVVLPAADGVEVGDDGLGVQGGAIVEGHVRAEEEPELARVGRLPPLGQPGGEPEVGRQPGEGLEDPGIGPVGQKAEVEGGRVAPEEGVLPNGDPEVLVDGPAALVERVAAPLIRAVARAAGEHEAGDHKDDAETAIGARTRQRRAP
jgi:hypothetical protein